MNKDNKIKTTCRKKYPLDAEEVADIAGASTSLVKKVRTAESSGVSTTGKKAKQIIAIDEIAIQQKELLIEELKKTVNK